MTERERVRERDPFSSVSMQSGRVKKQMEKITLYGGKEALNKDERERGDETQMR